MTIGYNAVKSELLKLAEERPDYTYENPGGCNNECRYSDADGNPSCIVGHVFAALTPDVFQEIHEYEEEINGSGAVVEILDMYTQPGLYSSEAMRVLQYAQNDQDRSVPWGMAVRRAIEDIEEAR